MAVFAGNLTSVGNPFQWSLLFARQPEPDLEFTEDELDQTTATRPISPMKPGKKPGGGRSMLLILLLLLVAGVGYIAMEPEQVADWLAPFMGETVMPEPPPIAMKPKPTPAPPPATPSQPPSDMGAPAPQTPMEAAPPPSAPPLTTAPPPPSSASPAGGVPSPMFAEGQKVAVIANPTIPAETVSLSLDPAGMKPGAVVRPSGTLIILDGDLQSDGWVYLVKTEDGTKGWISEKRLRLKF